MKQSITMTETLQSRLILSTGRTGTKYLAKSLQELIPDADVYHEAGERSRLINILSHAELAGYVSAQPAIRAWQKAVLPALQKARAGGGLYIDANNHVYLFAARNPKLYPNLKVIQIIRDPRDYIRSHVDWSRTRIKSFLANNIVPFWQPTGYLMDDMSALSWFRLTRLEKYAWIWKFKNQILAQFQTSEIPYLRIKFEELFFGAGREEVFRRMLDFIDRPAPDNLKDFLGDPINTSKQRLKLWAEWQSSTCIQIDQICGKEMREYGYGEEPEWLEKVSPRAEDS